MSDSEEIDSKSPIRLGLRENLAQFSLLVLVNAFVGGMVGLERTVVPLVGTEEFGIRSDVVVFSFMLAWGPSWTWIVAANVLLGISQGLAWSMTVNMKIDLVGPEQRGLAMGLNEAAGYGTLGATALVTGYVAAAYGLRPEPFYIGIVYAVLGLLL